MRDDAGHDAKVCAQRRAAVEAELADAERYGANNDVGDTTRAVWQSHEIAVAAAFTEHDRVGQGGGAGGDVAGEVEAAQAVDPAGGVSGPAGYGVVD